MIYSEDQVEQYFGYNSILTVDGKHLRRLRRTEVSSQKLVYMRYKSPLDSRTANNKTNTLRQNKSSQIQPPLAHSRSKLIIKYSSNLLNGFHRQKQDIRSDYESSQNGCQHNLSIQSSMTRTVRGDRNVQNKMGQYYFGSQAFEDKHKKSKKRSLSRRESNGPKIESCKNIPINRDDHSDYQVHYPNIPRQKMKKPGKVSQPNIEVDSKTAAQNRGKNTQRSNISQKEKDLQKEGSKLKVSKSSSKISQCSISQRQSLIKQENKQRGSKVNHFQSRISSHQSHRELPSPQQSKFSDNSELEHQRQSIIKSIVSAKEFNSQIQESKVSKISKESIADKIRSKMKSKLESLSSRFSSQKSRSSKLSKRSNKEQTQTDNFKIIDKSTKMVLTKKSTQAEESEKTGENYFTTPKMNKKVSYGFSEAKIQKQSVLNPKTTEKQQKNTFNPLPNTKSNPQMKSQTQLSSKKAMKDYTLEQVLKNIEEHDIRLSFIYLFVDNVHNAYQTPITFERYERLCFLVLKKYLFEKNRLIKTLEGEQCCLTLTEFEVPSECLQKYLSSDEIKQKLESLREETVQIVKQIQDQFSRIHKKYRKDKLIRLQNSCDVFSKQIMKLLMQELTKLYQELQADDSQNEESESSEKRIIEIIQIMFLMSELSGRTVKKFQMFQENQVDFNQYYGENYEKIIETTEYYEQLREY